MDAQLLVPRHGKDAYVDITVYIFHKDGQRPMTIVTQAVRLVDQEECVWVFWQPKIASRLGLALDQPITEGGYQMYHHDLGIWTALPVPTRPILVLPGRALLWRRTGVTTMPELESWITLTAHNATPIPDIPNLPSKIEPFFTRKSLATGPSFKSAVGLVTTPTKPRTARKPARCAPSLVITPRSTREKTSQHHQTATSSPRLPASPTSSRTRSSPDLESSSPPAPSQLLRDVFGTDWKAARSVTPTASTSVPTSTLKRAASSSEPETPVKRARYETFRGAKGTESARNNKQRLFIAPADVIEISSDEEDVVVVPPKDKGKGKAKERKPIPADAEIIEISD